MKQFSCVICVAVFLLAACATKVGPPTATLLPTTLPAVIPTILPTEIPPTATALPTGGRIEGRVFIAQKDKPLAGATVTLGDIASGEPVAQATADASGHYVIEGVKPGQYSLGVMWEFIEIADCPGGNMFGPSIMLFTKQDGTYILITTTIPKFEMKSGEDAKMDLRLLCSS